MQSLPPRLGPRSRRHIAQCMRKVLSLAVYPGRHIAVNPIPREWMPKIPKSANKAKSCLFPDEDARLPLRCRWSGGWPTGSSRARECGRRS